MCSSITVVTASFLILKDVCGLLGDLQGQTTAEYRADVLLTQQKTQ